MVPDAGVSVEQFLVGFAFFYRVGTAHSSMPYTGGEALARGQEPEYTSLCSIIAVAGRNQVPTPFWTAPGATLYHGEVIERLREMPARSIHTVITSPPYWNLKDYGTGEWEGGNAKCDHVKTKTSQPRLAMSPYSTRGGAKKVASDTAIYYQGVCGKCGARRIDNQLGMEEIPDCAGWATKALCGNCYVCHMTSVFCKIERVLRDDGTVWLNLGDSYTSEGNLAGIPWRVALALQALGWTLRASMPWIKKNSMPESVLDRPSKATEEVFLLTKGTDYYFDMDSVKVASTGKGGGAVFGKAGGDQHRKYDRPEYNKRAWRSGDLWITDDEIAGFDVPVAFYKGAHYATFSPRLITPMILAGTSVHGACAGCGKQYKPISSREQGVMGWRKDCGCTTDEVVPSVVLDPFVGSGTTVATALTLGRRGVGIDLNEVYLRDHAVPRIEAAIRARDDAPTTKTRVIVPDKPPLPQILR